MTREWRSATLGEATQFINGLWKGEDPPFVHVGVIRNTNFTKEGALDDSDIAYLDVEAKKFQKRRLQFGDLILEKSGGGPKQPVGRVVFFDKTEGDFSFSNFTSVIRVVDPAVLDARFLHKYLHWVYLSGRTEAMQSHSTGIRNLNGDAYKAIKVAYPSLPEQRRIVAILDEAFEGIATAKANAEKNVQNARELFRSHLEHVFLRHDDSSPAQALEALTQADSPITYGVVKPGEEGDVPFVRGGDIAQGRVLTEQLRTIDATVSRQYRRTLLRGGELLISLVGQPGQVAVAPAELKGANIARQVGLIRLNEQVDAEYVRYFLQSPVGQAALGAKQSGSVQQVINLGELREVMVPMPALALQRDAVKELDAFSASVERLTDLVQSKLAALGELKKSLLQQAFTGALTEKSTDKQVAEVA